MRILLEKNKVPEDQKKSPECFKCKKCEESFTTGKCLHRHIKQMHHRSYKCRECDNQFDVRWKLENHMKNHDITKEFKCDQCTSEFFLKCRLEQHIRGHSEAFRKSCHYFNNGKNCPFEDIGCKFSHTRTRICKADKNCKITLCQYRHTEQAHTSLKVHGDNSENEEVFEKGIMINSTVIQENETTKKSDTLGHLKCENSHEIIVPLQCDECYVIQFIQQKKQNQHNGMQDKL